MRPSLDVDLIRRGATATLTLRGTADVFTCPVLRDRISEVAADGATRLELDLTGLRFIDSSGLGVLADAHRTFVGAVTARGASGLVLRVLQVAATAPALSAHDRRLALAFAPTGMLSN